MLVGAAFLVEEEAGGEEGGEGDAEQGVAFRVLRSSSQPVASVQVRPAAKAPRMSGAPRLLAITMPGRTACEMASPISAQPLWTM